MNGNPSATGQTWKRFAADASIIKADANRVRCITTGEEKDWRQGDDPSRAVREYLAVLEEQNPAEDDTPNAGPPNAASRTISLTDPQSRYTAAPGGPAFFACSTNYLIDTQHGVILDVEATPAHRTAEVE